MQHSHFDLEIHARAYQDQALDRARQERLLEEARSRGQVSRQDLGTRISGFIDVLRALMAGPRHAVAPDQVEEASVPNFSQIVVAEEPPLTRPRPRSAAEPYGAMVIIARAANVPVAGQPAEVKDC